ncbi:MAG: transcription antitermination factor NusB [Oscillospiraceae bacterium]
MTRHQMRQYAFMLTFERIFNEDDIDSIIELAKECETVEVNRQVLELFKGVDSKKEILDAEIEKHLKNWTLSRISKVSLAVLRVAMYEILYCDDIDIDVAISEAVKIAQIYTMKEDVSFVNGVLSSVSKEHKK